MVLRKMTFKSIMGFGKYADLSVKQILDIGDDHYLRWVYYNASHINFFDDVLQAMRIPDNGIIEKPGKNPDMRLKIDLLPRPEFHEGACISRHFAEKRLQKARLISEGSHNNNTEYLRLKNHGH